MQTWLFQPVTSCKTGWAFTFWEAFAMSDKSSTSFSSFADLKDLQARLRRQEADQAQAKADAIVVKEGAEHTNPLKQKAARLEKYTTAAMNRDAERKDSAQKKDTSQQKGSASHTGNASHTDSDQGLGNSRGHSGSRDDSPRHGRGEHANDSSRSERKDRSGRAARDHGQGSRGGNGGHGRNSQSSNDAHGNHGRNSDRRNSRKNKATPEERLEQALNRLQNKADSLNRHHQKDQQRAAAAAAQNNERNADSERNDRNARNDRSDHNEHNGRNRNGNGSQSASGKGGKGGRDNTSRNRGRSVGSSEHSAEHVAERHNASQNRKEKGRDRKERSDRAARKNRAPLLQGRYFDLEALKAVRALDDVISWQARRQAYRRLSEIDSLILKTMQDLMDEQAADARKAASAASAAAAKSAAAPLDAAVPSADVQPVKDQSSASQDNPAEGMEHTADAAASEAVSAAAESAMEQPGVVAAWAAASVAEDTAPVAGAAAAQGKELTRDELKELALGSAAVSAKREQLLLWLEEQKADIERRNNNVPPLEYPESLPVSQRREEIVKAIAENQVVIIAGETGSGKTTQIPKMCLEAGYGRRGLIGHTQPRRLAARAVAARIAEEMHEQLGKSVSYKVRFTDISSPESYIKLMTDGILLSELASDRLLLGYDVIIIDEAHERSLNIDFLLGYLKNLLHSRPDLKLIITSATIDVERFSAHFDNAPIIEVSGRTYPVEVVYMPLMDDNRGLYIEGHDGKGRYENDHGSANHILSNRNDLIDAALSDSGPGAWRDYQTSGPGSGGGSMAALRAAAAASAAASASSSGAGSAAARAAAARNNASDDDRDLADTMDLRQGILQAIHYLQKRGRGDTLVFLPGERDILEISQFLRKAGLRDTEIVPLYARLATAEQNKIFTEHSGVRIVLATNVAETSLTVPGIRYVIDPGLARISRYSSRTKVQRLPIEPISQASANQRKGRCGRVSDGICVRLYSKEDFDNRPQFTDPEILRTNLASVLLQMASLRLGRIENFPFIDAPAPRQVSDGLRLLDELGAVSERPWTGSGNDSGNANVAGSGSDSNADGDTGEGRGRNSGHSGRGRNGDGDQLHLTQVGRMISRLPCDPRLGRMIVEASKYRALTEVLVIVSALAVMDPREYPLDKKEAAAQYHRRFNDEKSDFLSILKLYDYIRELQSSLSGSALRRQLKQEFISFLRVREWLDVLRQLRASAQLMGLNFNEEKADYESIHRSLISGLLSHLGMLEPNGANYIGARGSRFVIFPASALAKKPPKWICAAELSETSRLFARTVASIDPVYAEACAGHLIKNSYNEPHWSKKNGAVMASLTRSIYGLPIVQKRMVQYQDIDPRLCHELMISDGFVGGNLECNHRFFKHNISLIDDVEYLEDKVRRRDLLVDASTLEQFYAERIPEHICNIRDFDKWWKTKSKEDPHFLDFSYELIARTDIMGIEERSYPEFWHQGSLRFKLSYVFDIGSDRDGVTVHIPITVLNQVKVEAFLWQIPGMRNELFATLIRSLPKRLRRNLIPAPEYAKALEESLSIYTAGINNPDAAATAAGASGSVQGAGAGAVSSGNPARGGGLAARAAKSARGSDNLFTAVARELTRMGGEIVTADDFDRSLIPDYLFVNFSIEDVNGQEIAFGKDFTALSSRLQGKAREVLHQVVRTHKVSAPAQEWEYGTIKKEQVTRQGSLRITAYPALTDRGDGVTLELYDNPQRQARAMEQGAVKLIALSLKSPTGYLENHLPNRAKLSMYYQPLGSIKELIFDLMLCAIRNIMDRNGGVPWDEESFVRIKEIVRGELNDEALSIARSIEDSLIKAHELRRLLKRSISFDQARSYADMQAQLDSLIYKGFISDCGTEHLSELPRYLQAALERLQRLNRDVVRDQMYMRTLDNLNEEYQKVIRSYHEDLLPPPLKDVRWMIEELRVSYFAQHLGVNGPISDKRIYSELERITREWPPHK